MSDAAKRIPFSPKWQLLLLALIWTLLNCIKPVHIDDASYLKFAREFANHPLNPYAFQLNWDQWPEPAIWFTSPAVLPYWLAPAARWFYNDPFVIKLWMFPFAWLFAWSLWRLCRRFVGSHEMLLCWMTVLSGAFLPATNLMLDIPSIALLLGSVELLFVAIDRDSYWLAIGAGLLTALSIETKYTELVAPAVLLFAGIALRRWRMGLIAAVVACLAVGGWEALLWMKYGYSQMVAQLVIDDPRRRIGALGTIAGLPPYFAAPAPFLLLLALRGLRVRGWTLALIAIAAAVAILATIDPVFTALSAVLAIVSVTAIARLLRSVPRGTAQRPMLLFLITWLAIGLFAACFISPFDAVRRLFDVYIVLTLLLGSAAFAKTREPIRRIPWGVACAACVLVAIVFYASDIDEALARKNSIEGAARLIHQSDPNPHIWYVGHWGAEYYGERAGMKPLVPDETVVHAGDWLVVADGVQVQGVQLLSRLVKVVDRPFTGYFLRWSTARSYYGGIVPLTWHRPISDETPVPGLEPIILRVIGDGVLPSSLSPDELVDIAMHRGRMSPEGLARALDHVIATGTPKEAQSARNALAHVDAKAQNDYGS